MLVNNVVAYIFHFLSFFPHALLSFRTMYSPEQLSGCTRLEHSSYISITKTNWGSLSHFCSHLRSTLDARSDVVSHDNNVSSIKPLRSVWNKEQDRGERRYKKKKKKKTNTITIPEKSQVTPTSVQRMCSVCTFRSDHNACLMRMQVENPQSICGSCLLLQFQREQFSWQLRWISWIASCFRLCFRLEMEYLAEKYNFAQMCICEAKPSK